MTIAYAEPNPADAAFEAILFEPASRGLRDFANELARALARHGWNPMCRPRLEIRMDASATVDIQLEFCGFRLRARWAFRVLRAEVLPAIADSVVAPFVSRKPTDHPQLGPIILRDIEPILWSRDLTRAPMGEPLLLCSFGTVFDAELTMYGWQVEGMGPNPAFVNPAWARRPKGPRS